MLHFCCLLPSSYSSCSVLCFLFVRPSQSLAGMHSRRSRTNHRTIIIIIIIIACRCLNHRLYGAMCVCTCMVWATRDQMTVCEMLCMCRIELVFSHNRIAKAKQTNDTNNKSKFSVLIQVWKMECFVSFYLHLFWCKQAKNVILTLYSLNGHFCDAATSENVRGSNETHRTQFHSENATDSIHILKGLSD